MQKRKKKFLLTIRLLVLTKKMFLNLSRVILRSNLKAKVNGLNVKQTHIYNLEKNVLYRGKLMSYIISKMKKENKRFGYSKDSFNKIKVNMYKYDLFNFYYQFLHFY